MLADEAIERDQGDTLSSRGSRRLNRLVQESRFSGVRRPGG